MEKEKVIVNYEGVFLGAEWAEGKSKAGKDFAFGKVRIDFKGLKKDGTTFKQEFEGFVDSKDKLPGEDIEEYSRVLVEFEVPDLPTQAMRFVRIVRNI